VNQILHIFKKDARHHWPEILISLALLGLSTRQELHPWQHGNALYSLRPTFSVLAGRYVTPVTIIFWVFLIIRVVQEESLVGDRQWWVTKPYEWWKLLAAKLLFIFIFISVPLFHVQLLLLHQFGFPILPNLATLVLSQLAFYFVLFLPAVFLASLTKSFGQLLLTVGCILAAAAGIAWLASNTSSGDAKTPPAFVESFQTILMWGSFLVILGWQFARRRRLVSAAALLVVLGVNSLIDAVVPNARTMEKKYARVEAQASPAKIAIMQPTDRTGWRNVGLSADAVSDIYFNFPITVSGVAPGTMVMVDVMKITTSSPKDSKWSRGWKYQQVQIWPEDQQKSLLYQVDRKEYEKVKNELLNLHIELGLSEYREADARILSVPAGKFVDETLGVCGLDSWQHSSLQCLKPFHAPPLMATFNAQKFRCIQNNRSGLTQEDVVSHAWEYANHDSFPEPHYSPISDYSIGFTPVSLFTEAGAKPKPGYQVLIVCPGSEIRLARPELKRQVRLEFDLPNVRLQDLVESGGE
jgi:hypothetical protein